ncbi:MAG: hypothetical protein HXX09_06635 [Bacteroidetes bacterium]|nr:hypothetical protein [Bacteroidota bacterium]
MRSKIILLFTSFFVAIGFGSLFSKPLTNQNIKPSEPSISPEDSIKGPFTRKHIKEKLIELSKTKGPEVLNPGAMCYEISAPPKRAEYVCPKCGEKTIYTESFVSFITNDIPSCRYIVNSLKGFNAVLDESQFCKKCSHNIKSPELCFEVKYNDENETHKTCGISETDMELVSEFLNGSLAHKGYHGSEEPLINYIDRLETLLDIKITDNK